MKPIHAVLLAGLLLGGCGAKSAPSAASRPALDPWAGGSGGTGSGSSGAERNTKSGARAEEKGRLPKGAVVQVRVVGVTDGDTVKLLTPEKTEVKMRLNGIDAPESKMPYGTQAKTHLSDLVYDKTVTAKIDGYDRYGRALGVLTDRGGSVNARMVRDGCAWWYREYAKNDRELERLETEAKGARRGLWAGRSAQPPWEWRRAKRESSAAGRGQ